jgi:gentisate 1,2-dioxygenase
LRAQIERAGELISAEEAERRVLVLENPAFKGEGKATSSLYAGIQLILPGETAPSHRHTAAALRLVLEGSGAYTAVDGERTVMRPGDFIVTPSGKFHDHGNDGEQPVMWLDGLDVFVVNLLNAPIGEDYPENRQPVVRPEGEALARFGSGMLPHGYEAGSSGSPMFAWPYERTREALRTLQNGGAPDPALGIRFTYIDPATGRSPIKTMTAAMQLLPKGFAGQEYRSTAGTVMSVVEGRGRVIQEGQQSELGPKDVFVVPGWRWHRFEADEDLVIFSFSDEALQRHLGYWRDERCAGMEG